MSEKENGATPEKERRKNPALRESIKKGSVDVPKDMSGYREIKEPNDKKTPKEQAQEEEGVFKVELSDEKIDYQWMYCRLIGDSPLVTNRVGIMPHREILMKKDKSLGDMFPDLKSLYRGTELIWAECLDKCYVLYDDPWEIENGENSLKKLTKMLAAKKLRFGFGAVGLKKSMVNTAARQLRLGSCPQMSGRFFVHGIHLGFMPFEFKSPNGLPEYHLDPVPAADPGGRKSGKITLSSRPYFRDWKMLVAIRYCPDLLKRKDQPPEVAYQGMYNLVSLAGSTTGLGTWRTDRGGDRGAFHIEQGAIRHGQLIRSSVFSPATDNFGFDPTFGGLL